MTAYDAKVAAAIASLPPEPEPIEAPTTPPADPATDDRYTVVARVADAHNLPAHLVGFLTATDEDGLTAQAAKLAASIPAEPAPVTPERQRPALVPGNATPDGSVPFNADAMAAAIRKRNNGF